MRTRTLVLLTLPLILGLGMQSAAATPPAGADFGDTLTEDTKLTGDLSGSGSGLIVGADGITIDLNGYSLTMTGGSGYGIDNTDGYTDVTIKNGTIEDFNEGVRAEDADGLKLSDLEIIGASGHASVTGAIHVLRGEDVEIKNSSVSVTATFLGPHGIRLDSVDGVKVKNVDVDGSFIGISFFSVGALGPNTNGSIQGCTITGANNYGVLLATADRAIIQDNEISDCGTGLWAGGWGVPLSDMKIQDNYFHDNVQGGFILWDVSDSQVSGNTSEGNGTFGLLMRSDASDNKISDNDLSENGVRGLVLLFGANDNHISGNTVNDNAIDGISLFIGTCTGNKITDNTALGNGIHDLFHNATSTPNTWDDNDYDTKFGADIP
jgi:parallel beta-helix repeat protein